MPEQGWAAFCDYKEILHWSNFRPAYRAIKSLTGKIGNIAPAPVNRLDGSSCSSMAEILPDVALVLSIGIKISPSRKVLRASKSRHECRPWSNSGHGSPWYEIKSAINELKNGRAAGLHGITTDLLKYAIEPISSSLHGLFFKVWETGRVPTDLRDGVKVPLYKGKGSKMDCGSYRPISLLSVPGKVFAHVLLNRLNHLFIESRRPEQPDFTTSLSLLLSQIPHDIICIIIDP